MPDKRTGKAPRERQSCDICQASKIGCGQERPACARCVKQNLNCVYSLSRRAGRPRPKKNKAERRESQPGRDGTMPAGTTSDPPNVPTTSRSSFDVGGSHASESTDRHSPTNTTYTSEPRNDFDDLFANTTVHPGQYAPTAQMTEMTDSFPSPMTDAFSSHDSQQILNDLDLFTGMELDPAPFVQPEPPTPTSPNSVVHPLDLHAGTNWNALTNANPNPTSNPSSHPYPSGRHSYSSSSSYSNLDLASDFSGSMDSSSSISNAGSDFYFPYDLGSALTFDWSVSPQLGCENYALSAFDASLLDSSAQLPSPAAQASSSIPTHQQVDRTASQEASCACSATLLTQLADGATNPATATASTDANDSHSLAAAVQRSKNLLDSCTVVLDCRSCAPKLSSALLLCQSMNAVSLALGMGSLWSSTAMTTATTCAAITNAATATPSPPPAPSSPSYPCITSVLARNEVPLRCGTYDVRGVERRLMFKALVMKRLTEMQSALQKLLYVVQTSELADGLCRRTCADLARDLEGKVAVRVERFRNLKIE